MFSAVLRTRSQLTNFAPVSENLYLQTIKIEIKDLEQTIMSGTQVGAGAQKNFFRSWLKSNRLRNTGFHTVVHCKKKKKI